jgi:aspartyl/glutamyl-tRNA(Asn/Gln) amidotransferase C subunit
MGTEMNTLREDRVQGSLSAEEALSNAPDRHGDFFTVPKVIRK